MAQTFITVLVGGGAPAGLYLAWATYRDSSDLDRESLSLGAVADLLASVVIDQWQAEAARQRLNNPYPLPVRWEAADAALADSWESLKTLASSGAGWASSPTAWASGPEELAGGGNQLADVLVRVPTSRLVVLGEPGAGKTMLMIRLVLDLLARRDRGGAVPVLVSVASWDPTAEDLHTWLASLLMRAYPGLSAPAPQGCVGKTRIDALLKAGLILPILDGLDEISDGARGYAVSKINDALRPGEPLVVTSRTAAYLQAVQPIAGTGATLRAAVVKLSSLEASEVAAYLQRSAVGSIAVTRWAPVAAALRNPGPLTDTLAVPLMVGLARSIYNPQPGEHIGLLPAPAELCSFTSRSAIEGHLLDAFIPAVYRTDPASRTPRWTPAKAERWHGFLARHLERRIGNPDLNWWQLSRTGNAAVIGALAVGIATGISVALTQVFGAVFAAVTKSQSFGLLHIDIGFNWSSGSAGYYLGLYGDPFSISSIRSALELTLVAALVSSLVGGLAVAGSGELPRHLQFSGGWKLGRERSIPRLVRLAYGAASAVIVSFALNFTLGWYAWRASSFAGELAAVVVASVITALGAGNPGFRRAYSAAVVAGMIIGFSCWALFGASFGWVIGFPAGLFAGFTSAMVGNADHHPVRRFRWRPVRAVLTGTLIGLGIGSLAYWISYSWWATRITSPQVTIIVLGLTAGIAAAVLVGLEPLPGGIVDAMSPRATLIRDRKAVLLIMLMIFIVTGLAVSFITVALSVTWGLNYSDALMFGLPFGLGLGTSIALFFGLTSIGFNSAWPQWIIVREFLVLRRCLPQRLMTFLADARNRGVLRQVGTAYQFRHIELQHRLANRNTKETAKLRSRA